MSKEIDIDSWGKNKKQPPEQVKTPVVAVTPATPALSDASDSEGKNALSSEPRPAPRQTPRQPSKKDHETAVSRGSGIPATMPVKILDDAVLLDAIDKSSFNMEGEAYFRNWVTRKELNGSPKYSTGRARTAVLAYLVKIFRQLKNGGWE